PGPRRRRQPQRLLRDGRQLRGSRGRAARPHCEDESRSAAAAARTEPRTQPRDIRHLLQPPGRDTPPRLAPPATCAFWVEVMEKQVRRATMDLVRSRILAFTAPICLALATLVPSTAEAADLGVFVSGADPSAFWSHGFGGYLGITLFNIVGLEIEGAKQN